MSMYRFRAQVIKCDGEVASKKAATLNQSTESKAASIRYAVYELRMYESMSEHPRSPRDDAHGWKAEWDNNVNTQ